MLNGTRNIAPGMWNPSYDLNIESKFHVQSLEFGNRNPESNPWNPEFKTIMDSLCGATHLIKSLRLKIRCCIANAASEC